MVLGGAGNRLPTAVLTLSGISTVVAVLVSVWSIYLQLKSYRKPALQRMVIRIMIMVPIYAISSLISLFSLEAAFFIDAIRDIYEAFVIYCFFVLLLSYLGGERSLLILLHGRPPKTPPFPVSIFKHEIDVSDPYTFLFLKRGILQYVQIKPILAVATLILKVCGKFNEGNLRANSGYLYVSIIYNTSICLSLYCLAIFWICVNDDLKPFRPVPKFLCVKGILFFSFWQSFAISIMVAAGAITKLGPYTDSESISLGLTDTLICIEMPFFAIAHMFAFSYTDFIDRTHSYVARMPVYYAFRDAFGLLDVVEDSKATLRGEGMDYREFEPSEGYMHQGAGRDRRIRAGLRYVKGGKGKYWLPKPDDTPGPLARGVNRVLNRQVQEEVRAPLLADQADDVVHLAPDLQDDNVEDNIWETQHEDDGYDLPFGDLDDADEELFNHSKKYLFGDYNYPCIDVSSEEARMNMWDEEERVLRDERGAWFSPIRGAKGHVAMGQRQGPAWEGYGAIGTTTPRGSKRPNWIDNHDRGSGRLVDFDDDRTPPVESSDVRLKWSNLDRRGSGPVPHSSSPTKSRPARGDTSSGPSSAESSSGAAHRSRWSLSKSRSNSRVDSPVVQSDAVDLIVEDSEAAEEDRIRERRKGEPATRASGLRRVYKHASDTQLTEEGVEDPADPEDASDSSDSDDETARHSPERFTVEPLQQVVTELEEVPLHARVPHDSDIDSDNPWA